MTPATELEQVTTSFGTRTVTAEEHRRAVTRVVNRIAPRGDLMNGPMRFGTHRLWKRVVVARGPMRAAPGRGRVVAPAGGAGDMALALRRRLPERQMVVADAPPGTLGVARARAHAPMRGGVARTPAAGGHLALLEVAKPTARFAPIHGRNARHVSARKILAAGLTLVNERAVVFGLACMRVGRKT